MLPLMEEGDGVDVSPGTVFLAVANVMGRSRSGMPRVVSLTAGIGAAVGLEV